MEHVAQNGFRECAMRGDVAFAWASDGYGNTLYRYGREEGLLELSIAPRDLENFIEYLGGEREEDGTFSLIRFPDPVIQAHILFRNVTKLYSIATSAGEYVITISRPPLVETEVYESLEEFARAEAAALSELSDQHMPWWRRLLMRFLRYLSTFDRSTGRLGEPSDGS